jgi:hypothetical protein
MPKPGLIRAISTLRAQALSSTFGGVGRGGGGTFSFPVNPAMSRSHQDVSARGMVVDVALAEVGALC